MPFPSPPDHAREALDALAKLDPDLAGIEQRAGPLPWRTRPAGFAGLLQAMVNQQISNQAAAAIWRRLASLPAAITPAGFLTLSDDDLRAVGFSRPKVMHARALADAFLSGALDADRLAAMTDEDAIATIAGIRGLGRWTAEVYLVFALGRLDVFPAADIALANSIAHLRGMPTRPNPVALRKIAEDWRPARALAARLLWHHWRHATGRPAMDDMI